MVDDQLDASRVMRMGGVLIRNNRSWSEEEKQELLSLGKS